MTSKTRIPEREAVLQNSKLAELRRGRARLEPSDRPSQGSAEGPA